MLKTKLISGMEKCFLDECICKKFALDRDTMLKNERYTFQLAVQDDEPRRGSERPVGRGRAEG